MAAGSDLRLAAPSCLPDLASSSEDDSRQNLAARFALSPFRAAAVDSLAFVLVSAVADSAAASVPASAAASAVYCPACFAPNSRAVLARKPAQPALHRALLAIPRFGVSVSFSVTSADSDWSRLDHRPAPVATGRSAEQNPKSHHNFLARADSG